MRYYQKIQQLILFSCLPLFIYSCGDNVTGFDMVYQLDLEIPAGLNTFDAHGRGFVAIPTNKTAFLTANGIEEQEITKITPRQARLSVFAGDEDFYFIRNVIVEMEFPNGDNTRLREIFFRENVPLNTGNAINILASLTEVTDILLGDDFSVNLEYRLRDISPTFIRARLELVFLAEYER